MRNTQRVGSFVDPNQRMLYNIRTVRNMQATTVRMLESSRDTYANVLNRRTNDTQRIKALELRIERLEQILFHLNVLVNTEVPWSKSAVS